MNHATVKLSFTVVPSLRSNFLDCQASLNQVLLMFFRKGLFLWTQKTPTINPSEATLMKQIDRVNYIIFLPQTALPP